MAGHSKWANIRFRKAAQDNRRGKLFSKLIREITVATRTGNPDPENNPRLRSAIDKALAANMTRDVINRAIQRGSGDTGGDDFQDVVYEGYGPGGVAILIECSTDNRNRTVSELRHTLSKHGGNLGTEGSVAYMFNRVGLIQFLNGSDEEQIMDAAVSAGADDIDTLDDGSIMVSTPVEYFSEVINALEEAKLNYEDASIEQRSSVSQEIGEDSMESVLNLINAIEDLDDVNDVYSNAVFATEQ